MAKVEGQSVPPSFSRDFQALFETSDRGGINEKVVGPAKSLWTPPADRDSGLTGILAGYVGNWFAEHWKGHPEAEDLTLFFSERRQDILGNRFLPQFWETCTRVDDNVEKCFPGSVKEYTKPVAPEYYMETRRPSQSYLTRIGLVYPFADINEAMEKPQPGWEGRVISGMFRDLWSAQERIQYLLPYSTTKKGKQPLVVNIHAEIQAESSDRGVVSWFTVQTLPQFYRYAGSPVTPEVHIISRWNRAFQPRIELPDATPYAWNFTYTTDISRDARIDATWQKQVDCNRVWLRVGTPPSQGLYFGRNWDVRLRNVFTVRLYQARYPHA